MHKHSRMLLATMATLALSPAFAQDAKPPIKIGLLEDQSGEIALMTLPKVRGTQLAVEEINAAGGIDGRQLVPMLGDEIGKRLDLFFAEKQQVFCFFSILL